MSIKKKNDSELAVITEVKDLCDYVLTVTESSPKRYRFTLVTRLQNYALGIVEAVLMANEVYMDQADRQSLAAALTQRRSLQKRAMRDMKLLGYISRVSREHGCLTQKQYECISRFLYQCQRLLSGWVSSDDRRYAQAAGLPTAQSKRSRTRSGDIPRDASLEQTQKQQTAVQTAASKQTAAGQSPHEQTPEKPAGTRTAAPQRDTGTQKRSLRETDDDVLPWSR